MDHNRNISPVIMPVHTHILVYLQIDIDEDMLQSSSPELALTDQSPDLFSLSILRFYSTNPTPVPLISTYGGALGSAAPKAGDLLHDGYLL